MEGCLSSIVRNPRVQVSTALQRQKRVSGSQNAQGCSFRRTIGQVGAREWAEGRPEVAGHSLIPSEDDSCIRIRSRHSVCATEDRVMGKICGRWGGVADGQRMRRTSARVWGGVRSAGWEWRAGSKTRTGACERQLAWGGSPAQGLGWESGGPVQGPAGVSAAVLSGAGRLRGVTPAMFARVCVWLSNASI